VAFLMFTPILVVGGALAFTLLLARLGRERVTLIDGAGVRFSGFNALRALAALGVVAGHTLATSPLDGLPRAMVGSMATGVALFFVISGFLLYRPFAASLSERSKVSIGRFIANRALRILPLYVLVVVVLFFATTGHPAQSLMRLVRALSFTGGSEQDDLLPVAWSLDDEVAFYMLLPALYLALMAWPRPGQRLWLGAGAIAVLSIVSLVALAVTPNEQLITGGPLTKFHLFGFGMLLATVHARWPRFQISPKLLLSGAVVVATALSISSTAYQMHLYFFNPVCGLAFFTLVGMVAFSGPTAHLTRALSWRPLSHLGDVSYGVYLWHEPIHHVLYNMGLLTTAYIPGFLELAMCSIALATGTYYVVEKPALRIKNRWAASPSNVVSPRVALASVNTAALPVPEV
jgi:peptidoglycan/LPS O-acetylase OafA/YrhL